MSKRKKISIGNKTLGAISETLEAGTAAQNNNTHFEVLPVAAISLDPENPRKLAISLEDIINGLSKEDPEYAQKLTEYEELKHFGAEIKKDGLIQPITVQSKGEGRFTLVAGERRLLGSKIAGINRIPAFLRASAESEYKLKRIQWSENAQRKDLTPWERVTGLYSLYKTYLGEINPEAELSIPLIQELAGCGKTEAWRYKTLLSLYQEKGEKDPVIAALKANKITNFTTAANLVKSKDPEKALLNLNKKDQEVVKQPLNSPNSSTKRAGRKATQVSFGKTKNITVAKNLLNALADTKLGASLKPLMSEIDWEDKSQISELFNNLLKQLEQSTKDEQR